MATNKKPKVAVRTVKDGESVQIDGVSVTVTKLVGRGNRYLVKVAKDVVEATSCGDLMQQK